MSTCLVALRENYKRGFIVVGARLWQLDMVGAQKQGKVRFHKGKVRLRETKQGPWDTSPSSPLGASVFSRVYVSDMHSFSKCLFRVCLVTG